MNTATSANEKQKLIDPDEVRRARCFSAPEFDMVDSWFRLMDAICGELCRWPPSKRDYAVQSLIALSQQIKDREV